MPRIARKDLCGNFFHVIIQGINREDIFEKDCHKKKILKLVKKYFLENNITVLAYVVMNNHVHLLIYLKNIDDLSKSMHKIDSIYGMYYNTKMNRIGYVFRDRYFVKPITSRFHLNACFTYIHKNPVSANIVKKENMYKYSSYNEYLYEKDLIDDKSINIMFGTTCKEKYIKDFISLHRCVYKQKIMDVKEDIDFRNMIKKYYNNGFSEKIIIKKLNEEYHLSQREIGKYLKINRYKVRKALES